MRVQSEEEANTVSILAQLRAIRAVLREMAVVVDPPREMPVPLQSIASQGLIQPTHAGDERAAKGYHKAP